MKKLACQSGETLVELLVSMLIISLGMLMLSGAVVSSARLNKRASNQVAEEYSREHPRVSWAESPFDPSKEKKYPITIVSADGGDTVLGWIIVTKEEDDHGANFPP